MQVISMQSLSWDNYQYVLAIHRCQTIAGAARSLGVNETTVSRRLVQTERFLQSRLFSRRSSGLVATDSGLRLIQRLERVKFELDEGQAEVATGVEVIGGSLRVASELLLLNYMLVPSLHQLLDRHTSLSCELLTICANNSLKDCDVAVRYSDFINTGDSAGSNSSEVLGAVEFGVFAATRWGNESSADSIPWLVESENTKPKVQDSAWGSVEVLSASSQNRVRMAGAETLLSCAAAGLGKCLLPKGVGLRNPALVQLNDSASCPPQDVVRLCQPELLGTDRLAACDEWLKHCVHAFNEPAG